MSASRSLRALRNVNRRYQALMGLDPSLVRGNRLYRIAHEDLDPLLDRLNRLLALTPEEQSRFLSLHTHPANAPDGSDRLEDYQRENLHTLEVRARQAVSRLGAGDPAAAMNAPAHKRVPKTPLAALGAIFSTWVVAPAVFLFLLRDTGEIKRGFLRTVPNRLFEPALAILTDLDRAVGGYVRGVFLESSALAISVALLLAILGVPINWAILIGLVSGAANPVPYIGSAVALFGGLAYVLFSDEVHPLLPMIRDENVGLWMVVGVLAIAISLAIIGLIAHYTPMSVFVLNMTTMIGLGVGIDYSLLVVTRFREETARGLRRREAAMSTLRTAGKAVIRPIQALKPVLRFCTAIGARLRPIAATTAPVTTGGITTSIQRVPAASSK